MGQPRHRVSVRQVRAPSSALRLHPGTAAAACTHRAAGWSNTACWRGRGLLHSHCVCDQQAAAGKAQHAPTVPEIPDRPGLVVQAGQVVRVLAGLWVLWAVLFLKWLHPGFLSVAWGLLLGGGAGAAGVYLFYINVRTKKVLNDGVRPPAC